MFVVELPFFSGNFENDRFIYSYTLSIVLIIK